ncbi:acetate kinase [Tessaracoccus bendigoensis DSM 12906]|uniref:Acetate kinase n=1 Tax=Tessaracoccus bendigoensis DSM 12906 TaxID=1123357 RepID=A0A1M6GK25_9ACTN|nr:acetate kinase [Tessaracoccus bendigoensis]SHJ10266.1 acetate kinase [Tessaracoccus bendigoensis DSM 12906]
MSQPILLLNCGSSSIKYQLLDPAQSGPQAVGIVQRIGQEMSTIDHEVGDAEYHEDVRFADHTEAVGAVVRMFAEHGPTLENVVAVGHRTVHGGSTFVESTLIDDSVVAKLDELSDLAPLHNPPGIAGIRAAKAVLPNVPHVAVFDTAFFATLPAEAYTYAIDAEVAATHGIRKYGFHGTSHHYVSKKTAEYLGRPLGELKTIVCHLGNGASISAVDGGVAVETSMGLTPLQGLVMGTRSGDVDPGLPKYLSRSAGMSIDDVDELLNRRSGMGGLCGYTDMRDIKTQIEAGNEQAQLALDVYVHRLVGYIGSYIAILGGVDALVFTAGVGENAAHVRGPVIRRLAGLGFELDEAANLVRSKEAREISTPESKVRVLVIPTNEELEMAQETLAIINGLG